MGIKMKKIIKKIGIGLAAAALIMVCAVLVYVGYVYVSYKRLPDMLELEIEEPVTGSGTQDTVKTGVTYRVLTYNIGFGAYTPEFSFFMDGGKSSVGESRESVIRTVTGAADLAAGLKPDFAMFEEVDRDSTRSYHMDLKAPCAEAFRFPHLSVNFLISTDATAYPGFRWRMESICACMRFICRPTGTAIQSEKGRSGCFARIWRENTRRAIM